MLPALLSARSIGRLLQQPIARQVLLLSRLGQQSLLNARSVERLLQQPALLTLLQVRLLCRMGQQRS